LTDPTFALDETGEHQNFFSFPPVACRSLPACLPRLGSSRRIVRGCEKVLQPRRPT
jgi:hypothetical protein